MPGLTPRAIWRLPWRYAMSLLVEGARRAEQTPDGRKVEAVEPVECKAGGVYPDWYSRLLRWDGTIQGLKS